MRESMFEEKGRDPGEEVYNTPEEAEDMFDHSPENEHEYPPQPVELSAEEERLLKEAEENPPAVPFPDI